MLVTFSSVFFLVFGFFNCHIYMLIFVINNLLKKDFGEIGPPFLLQSGP